MATIDFQERSIEMVIEHGARLRRTVLYTSCEPCAMCVGKMYWAGIRSVVYALSSEDLAVMAGPDFLVPCRELFQRATETVSVVEFVEVARELTRGR